MTTLVGSGLSSPAGIAIDAQGNVDIADSGNNAIKQWNAASQQVVTLVPAGLNGPWGLGADAQGNVYVADTGNAAVRKLSLVYVSFSAGSRNEGAASGTDSILVQVLPASTQLFANSDQPWLGITALGGGVISFQFQANTSAASRVAHLIVLGVLVTVTQTGDQPASVIKCAGDGQSAATGQAFLTALEVCITDANGVAVQGAAVTFTVTPGTTGAGGAFNSTPAMPVLTDQNGDAFAPALTANAFGGSFTVTASTNALSVTFNLTNVVDTLSVSAAVVGNAAGSGSVQLLASGPWTAVSNAPWLQLAPGSSSGTGNALIEFTYGANTSASPQSGTLTIAGLTFTVTQAGTGFIPVNPATTLVSSGLKGPQGVAVDGQGNVYISDTGNNAIKEWNPATQQLTTLVSTGLNTPLGAAVDVNGNVYFADSKNNAIKEWNASTQQVIPLVSSALSSPAAVALDGQGNVYIADSGHSEIKEWIASSASMTTLVSSGISGPRGVAVDALGNVYFSDTKNNAIKELGAVSKQVITLVSAGLNGPNGLAADAQGNVYTSDTSNNAIKLWSPASQQVATLVASGLKAPRAVATDAQGNVYIADTNNNAIKKVTPAYLSLGASSRSEGSQAGTDSVAFQVLPAGTPVSPTSSQSWLTITGTSSGAISFSFKANTSVSSRTAKITILGQQVTVTQNADVPASMAKIAGNSQSTPAGQTFATALEVKVKDAAGNGVQGAAVTFTVKPGTGGSGGTFSSSPPMPILTNSSGFATAPALTANGVAGSFTVTATAGNLTTTFNLTVTP